MPARFFIVEAIYTEGIISLPSIIDMADQVTLNLITIDGLHSISGTYSAQTLAEGIYIGDINSFTITITLPNSMVYTGIYSI